MIKDFKLTSQDKAVFNNELKEYLPPKIIDSHVHLWNKDQINPDNVSLQRKERYAFLDLEAINEFCYSDFEYITKKIFPQIEYSGIFFGFPYREVNIEKTNKMISADVLSKKLPSLFITIPTDKSDFLEKKVTNEKFLGFKPYPDLAVGLDYDFQDSVSIFDFLPEAHLEVAEKYKLLVVLHIPKANRLEDVDNLRDILLINKSYPNVKLILAHAGRSYCLNNLLKNIKKISKLQNVFVDTAMINECNVIDVLLEYFGSERIIFGSDLPIAALRGKNICMNNKHYFFTYLRYSWSISDNKLKEDDLTFFIYEEVRAILLAILKRKIDRKIINNIFYQNAQNLINDIKV